MLKLECESKRTEDELNTKATLDIQGERLVVTREVACAINDLIKYSVNLGEDEHMYVMREIKKTIAELRKNAERKINGQ